MAYKADQGRIVRLVAFWALALLIFLAGRRGYVRFPPTRTRPARPAPGG